MHTRLAIVLDRSNNTAPFRDEMIQNFNTFLDTLKTERVSGNAQGNAQNTQTVSTATNDCTVSINLFNDQLEYSRPQPIQQVRDLTGSTYQPKGKTALYDAMTRTIIDLGLELENMPEQERPDRVILMTISCGLENASNEYTPGDVAKHIITQRQKYNWEFIFLGTNQDAVTIATGLNIPRRSALTWNTDGIQNAFQSVAGYINLLRTATPETLQNLGFTDEDRKSALSGSVKKPATETETVQETTYRSA